MSLARTALRGVARSPAAVAPATRRQASGAAHDDHHHHEEDTTVYPPEGFNSRGWIYTIAGIAGVVAFYKYAPSQDSDNGVKRWIQARLEQAKNLQDRSDEHLALSAANQDGILTIQSARRPSSYRIRHAEMIGSSSPFSVPVGSEVDLSGVRVKGDHA
ncbi:hypothetical protein PENSPDRAFT_584706 [Peniophora sp. CONT]|nr:hypothetical protein PENSPDRAFT_584706 [Peniophora sp. CONT]